MAELKPCPFCGGVFISAGYVRPFMCDWFTIRCLGCGAEVIHNTKEEAIEAWNRRAEDGK